MKDLRFLILVSVILLGLGTVPSFVFGLTCSQDSDCPQDQFCQEITNICVFRKGANVSVTIGRPTVEPPIYPPSAGIVFEGEAYPSAYIALLKDNSITATFLADSRGLFFKSLTGLSQGAYRFGIWAEDTDGRISPTLSFTIDLISGFTATISGIFLPPTIALDKTQVARGDSINISGQVFPGSEVRVFILPGETTENILANPYGKWNIRLNTEDLAEGEYRLRAKAFSEQGRQSLFSQELSFSILPAFPPLPPKPTVPPKPPVPPPGCRGADLNFDGRVDLVDFSILLYYWEKENPTNPCSDINSDGVVNIVDFSIMMYWWTG